VCACLPYIHFAHQAPPRTLHAARHWRSVSCGPNRADLVCARMRAAHSSACDSRDTGGSYPQRASRACRKRVLLSNDDLVGPSFVGVSSASSRAASVISRKNAFTPIEKLGSRPGPWMRSITGRTLTSRRTRPSSDDEVDSSAEMRSMFSTAAEGMEKSMASRSGKLRRGHASNSRCEF